MATEASRSLFGDQIEEICDQAGVSGPDAFARWICQNILGIAGEGAIDEAVSIGGKNDYGIDVFHANEDGDITERYVCWVQAKFSQSLDHGATREELESFASTLGHLRDCPDLANRTFKQKAAEFAKMEARHPGIRKRMIFAVAGRLNSQARGLIGNPRWSGERLGPDSDSVEFEVLDLDEILSRIILQHTPALKIKFEGSVIERTDGSTGKKSITGYVSADDVIKIVKTHKETIFLSNLRETLGKTAPTHRAILNTLDNPETKKRFWKLNNGITATCTELGAAGDPAAYRVDDFKIVNGRQTTYTLENTISDISDVFLQMTIHEVADDDERSQISEATNTQNPIKPADLVTNYPEMTSLVLQCRKDFRDFYFERQTKGFKSATKPTQNRVTERRVLEKSAAARAYYAYEIDPNGAAMPDKILFSATNDDSHYYKIFKGRSIRDLIIPHIFMHMLNALHKKWCAELGDNPSDETSRNKGIISKDIVRYYILRFVYESMLGIDDSARQPIKEKLIERFRALKKGDAIPDEFFGIAEATYGIFMFSYDAARGETWPPELMEKINAKNYKKDESDKPTPYEMADMLKREGDRILPHLLDMRKYLTGQGGDGVAERLLKL